MSGVSVTSGANLDLDAIVAGGDAFMTRIKELQTHRASVDASLAALKIGNDAAAAYADAQTNQANALKLLADAKEQSEKTIAGANEQAVAIITAAQDKADAILDASRKEAGGLDAQVADARKVLQDWSDKTTADANSIMASAVATKVAADKQLSDNQQATRELAKLKSDAQASLDAANAKQAALDAKIQAIKAAAS